MPADDPTLDLDAIRCQTQARRATIAIGLILIARLPHRGDLGGDGNLAFIIHPAAAELMECDNPSSPSAVAKIACARVLGIIRRLGNVRRLFRLDSTTICVRAAGGPVFSRRHDRKRAERRWPAVSSAAKGPAWSLGHRVRARRCCVCCWQSSSGDPFRWRCWPAAGLAPAAPCFRRSCMNWDVRIATWTRENSAWPSSST